MNALPPPPAIIKINDDFSAGLDLRNPIHAAAYLKAASHLLSSWPQDWSAERLCLALVDEESDDQKQVTLWAALERIASEDDTDPHLYTDTMICDIAEDFLKFAKENQIIN